MRLKLLAEATPQEVDIIRAGAMKSLAPRQWKKQQDPNYPEHIDSNPMQPLRTGNQDTPLKPRHRKFFNAPTGTTQGKIGFGDVDDAESRRPAPAGQEDEWPLDQDEEQQKIQSKARSVFGKDAQHGQAPRPGPSQFGG